MRTAIFLGAIMIASAIYHIAEIMASKTMKWPDKTLSFLAIVLAAMIVMDIVDFFIRQG